MLRRTIVALLLLILASLAAAQGGMIGSNSVVQGNSAANPNLAGVSFEPQIGTHIPVGVGLKDDTGKAIPAEAILHGHPVVILPIFYRCQGVCTTELQGVVNALMKNPKIQPGRDVDVVVLGLHPKEGPDLAAAKKAEVLEEYGHPETAKGWTFLTGPRENIARVANALGVHYTYDPVHDTVNHPSAVIVLTPDGRESMVMTEGMYPAAQFAADIARAAQSKVADTTPEVSWLGCVHTDPITGKRSLAVQGVMRMMGVAVVLALLGTMVFFGRRGRGGPVEGLQ